MAEKIATRAAYGEALVALAEEYPELVVLDADLSGSTMTKGFAKAHPDRFYNMGIAEANMTGVAAGLAACGKKPFTNTFAMFAAGRAWEQVRNSIAYPRLNVKVVGSHGGLSVGEDGATHQCIEDYAIMRAIPNMMVVSPCDGPEMRQAVRALLDYDGPAYLRLGRLAVESVTDAIPGYTFHLGQGVTLRRSAWRKRACPSGCWICTPSSPWTGSWCSRRRWRPGPSSPPRRPTWWAAWARRWRSSWPSTTRCRWCATA